MPTASRSMSATPSRLASGTESAATQASRPVLAHSKWQRQRRQEGRQRCRLVNLLAAEAPNVPEGEQPFSRVMDSSSCISTDGRFGTPLPAAAMVGDSWMGKHFEVVGDRSTHYGKFA